MIETILTHPGGAHKDELLAVCVLISKTGAPVLRREPTAGDLSNPAIAVIDVGGEHDPSKMNFDHHHFPREHPPTCALSLVLDHLGLYADALQLCDWLEPAEWFDSRGPKKTAEWLGVPRKAISQLNSPIDGTLLRRFAQSAQLASGEPLYEAMRFVGDDIVDYLERGREGIAFVAKHAERWSIPHQGAVIEAVFLPRTDAPADEPRSSIDRYVRDQGLESVVAAIIYPDRRGEGYGIGRFEDHPQLDFSRVAEEEDVRFAHKSGFMCKTASNEPERLRQLIVGAWIPRD